MALINDFMSLIYPRSCEACGQPLFRHERLICNLCILRLPKSDFHLKYPNTLSQTLGGRVPLEKTLCLYVFEKSGKVQRMVHAIKYQGQKELAILLGNMLAKEYMHPGNEISFDSIVPVPLHPKKEKLRGYNQSVEFAKGISEVFKRPLHDDILIRVKESATQTRKKKFDRWENVEGIFALRDKGAFQNQHVLLVDDVVTTGATVDAAWQCLKEVEGLKISIACLAFAKLQ
jgi:competence protein ComFC